MASEQMLRPRLLHLGCGLTAPDEWLNVDGSWNAWLAQRPRLKRTLTRMRLVPKSQMDIPWPTNVTIADVRRKLPFPEGVFDAAYASHLLEHLYRDAAIRFLVEVQRVVRSGGLVRLLVPDLAAIVREYRGEATMEGGLHQDDSARRLCERLLMRAESSPHRGLFRSIYAAKTDFHSHKWMYDGASLARLMTEAGLHDCQIMSYRESKIPHIDVVEMPGRFLNGAGVAVEGRRI